MTTHDATNIATRWLEQFEDALRHSDPDAAATLFADDCYWRDLVTFTWNIKTLEGRGAVREMLRATQTQTNASNWVLSEKATDTDGVIDAWFDFETGVGRGKGRLRLKDGRCWILLTALRELKGFEEKSGRRRELGTEHGVIRGRKTWLERRGEEEASVGRTVQPYCLIIGGGQGGLGLAARLRRIGVPTLVIEKHERPGDSWRKRYKSLCLHDPVWFDHMPYLPFPDHWPVFTPKDKMGEWLEAYARLMELNCWTSTECGSANYDSSEREWAVDVIRAGERITLKPKHLVLATGMSGVPEIPRFPGAESFKGPQHHSSKHPGSDGFAGKRCVIVGANNSAHDIAADLWEHGADVTMVQRSSTLVVKSETFLRYTTSVLYSEDALDAGITTDKADLIAASTPFRLLPALQTPVWDKIRKLDADYYDRLRSVGFMLDFGEDESGLQQKYLRRGSGYYIDVGASDLIAEGKIKLRSGVTVLEIKPHSLVLSNGEELEADVIVYATGFGSMNGWAEMLISREVADKVGPCWGVGSNTAKDPGPWEGELRNMWKPTRQEALWFHGGNLAQSRHYSLYLALQLKARMEGIPTPVYGLPTGP